MTDTEKGSTHPGNCRRARVVRTVLVNPIIVVALIVSGCGHPGSAPPDTAPPVVSTAEATPSMSSADAAVTRAISDINDTIAPAIAAMPVEVLTGKTAPTPDQKQLLDSASAIFATDTTAVSPQLQQAFDQATSSLNDASPLAGYNTATFTPTGQWIGDSGYLKANPDFIAWLLEPALTDVGGGKPATYWNYQNQEEAALITNKDGDDVWTVTPPSGVDAGGITASSFQSPLDQRTDKKTSDSSGVTFIVQKQDIRNGVPEIRIDKLDSDKSIPKFVASDVAAFPDPFAAGNFYGNDYANEEGQPLWLQLKGEDIYVSVTWGTKKGGPGMEWSGDVCRHFATQNGATTLTRKSLANFDLTGVPHGNEYFGVCMSGSVAMKVSTSTYVTMKYLDSQLQGHVPDFTRDDVRGGLKAIAEALARTAPANVQPDGSVHTMG